MKGAHRFGLGFGLGLVLLGTSPGAQDAERFPPDQVKAGGDVYATYCQPCHGPELDYPGGSFDLRKFPPGQYARFESAVTKGKNNMPPWGEVIPEDQIKALYAYVMAAERK